jgi:hypothetical protein
MTRILVGLGVGLGVGAIVGAVGLIPAPTLTISTPVFAASNRIVIPPNEYVCVGGCSGIAQYIGYYPSVFDVVNDVLLNIGGGFVWGIIGGVAAVVACIVSLGLGLTGRLLIGFALGGAFGLGLGLGRTFGHESFDWGLVPAFLNIGTATLTIGVVGGAVGHGGQQLGRYTIGRLTARGRRGSAQTAAWRRAYSARLLGSLLRLLFGRWGEVKLEEWFADLAEIDSRWVRTIYLLDLLFDLPRLTIAIRERGPKEPA